MTSGQKNILILELRAADMRNVDGAFGRKNVSKNRIMKRLDRLLAASDPFFEVFNADDEIVARSEVIMDNLNPKWPALHIDLNSLCKLNLENKVNISFHDWEKDGNHVFMGNISTTVQELIGKATNAHATSSRRTIRKQEPSFRITVQGKAYGKIYVVKAHTAWGTAQLVHSIDGQVGLAGAVDELKHNAKTRKLRNHGSPKSTEEDYEGGGEGFEVVVGPSSSMESFEATPPGSKPSSPRNIATPSSAMSPIGAVATERSIEWEDKDVILTREESAPLTDDSGTDAEALLRQAEEQRLARLAVVQRLAQEQEDKRRRLEKEKREQEELRRVAAEEDVKRKIAEEEEKLRIAQLEEEKLKAAEEEEKRRISEEEARLQKEAEEAKQQSIEQKLEQERETEEEAMQKIAQNEARIRREWEEASRIDAKESHVGDESAEMLQSAQDETKQQRNGVEGGRMDGQETGNDVYSGPIDRKLDEETKVLDAKEVENTKGAADEETSIKTKDLLLAAQGDADADADASTAGECEKERQENEQTVVVNGQLDDHPDESQIMMGVEGMKAAAAPHGSFTETELLLLDKASDEVTTKSALEQDSIELKEDAQATSNRVLQDAGLGVVEDSAMTDILVLEMWATDVKNVDGMFGEQMDFGSSSSERLMSRVTGFFGASDPYFEVANSRDRIVARSKVMMDNLNPKWPPVHIDLDALCHKKLDRAVYLTFYDFESDRKPQFLGHIKTSVDEILQKADDCKHGAEAGQAPSFRITVEHEEYGKVYVVDAKVTVGVPDTLQEAKDQFILPEDTFVQSEARRLSDEAEARQLAELEAQRLAEEEAEKKAAELEKKRLEELEKKRLEELEAQRLAEEKRREEEAAEKRRQEELEARRLAELEEKRRAEEAEKAAAEKRRLEELEAMRLAEIEKQRLAEEAEKAAAEKRRLEELEAKRQAEIEEKRLAEEAAKEAAEKRRLAKLEAKRLAEIEQQRHAEEVRKKKEAQAAEKKRLEELEAKRLAELEAKRAAKAEARRLQKLEAKRLAEEEATRKAAEEEERRLEEKREREEAARVKAENEARRLEALERKRKEDEEAARMKAEERAHRFADEESKRKAAALATMKRLEQVKKQTEMDAATRAAEEARLREERKALVEKRRAEEKEAKMKGNELANQKAREAAQRVAHMKAKERARAAGLDTSLSPQKSPRTPGSGRGDVFERLYKQDTTSCSEKRVNRRYFDN